MGDLFEEPPKASAVPISTSLVREHLRKRYPVGEWAFLEEVAPATGGGTRYADGIAVNLWQSRGHAVHGFEIKVSRSDWLRELKDPAKAEPLYRYCDHWWVVAPKDIVKDGELPPTWGLLIAGATGLTVKVAAPRLEPAALTRAFFASLIRRGHEQVQSIAERMQRDNVNKAYADIQEQVARQVKQSTREHAELLAKVEKFEQKTGLSFSGWSGPPIKLVKLASQLQRLGYDEEFAMRPLAHLADQLEKAATTVRDAIKETKLNEEPHGQEQ